MKDPRLREGDSFQAKFYRFKDRILPEFPIEEMLANRDRFRALDVGNIIQTKLAPKWRAMLEDPGSEEAYREACAALRSYRELLLDMGVECPPYADPED